MPDHEPTWYRTSQTWTTVFKSKGLWGRKPDYSQLWSLCGLTSWSYCLIPFPCPVRKVNLVRKCKQKHIQVHNSSAHFSWIDWSWNANKTWVNAKLSELKNFLIFLLQQWAQGQLELAMSFYTTKNSVLFLLVSFFFDQEPMEDNVLGLTRNTFPKCGLEINTKQHRTWTPLAV